MPHLDDGALQAWLDVGRSGLSADERREMQDHLAACAGCARRVEALQASSVRVRTLLASSGPGAEAVPPFDDVVTRAHRRPSRDRRRWRPAAWAASVALAMGVGWGAHALLPTPRGQEGARDRASAGAGEAGEAGGTTVADARTVLQGRVTDASGQPLAGAQVFVAGTDRGTLSNQEGRFSLFLEAPAADTAAQEVTVVAQILGYASERRPVTVGEGPPAAIDFRLPAQDVSLDALVVTAAAGDTAPAPVRPAAGARAVEGSGGWVPATLAEAEARVGFPPLTVPGLAVAGVEVRGSGEDAVVRVRQALEGGGVLELVESLGPGVLREETPADGRSRLTTRRHGLRIAATAPVAPDRLRALVEALR